MGTVGHNDSRDNWFWSNGNLDNQAWDDAQTVAATGRITQLTAYMAGDNASMVGGPTLHDGAGNLLLYTAQSIARRSAPYSGGFDGTGRNPNDGYYINVYGFNHVFTDPSSFKLGAFRRSIDSWILGFNDHAANFGHLKTTGTSSPSTATGGNSWSSQSGYSGGVQAYATYVPLGMFARVGGAWVPVTGKRFFDSTTTYFNTVMEDSPIDYLRVDESGPPYLNYGSRAVDGIDGAGGPMTLHQSAVIVDADYAGRGSNANSATGIRVQLPNATIVNQVGPLNYAMEAWFKLNGVGPSNLNPIFIAEYDDSIGEAGFSPIGPEGGNIYVIDGTDLFILLGSKDYAGLENQSFYTITVPDVVSVGPIYHVVVRYTCGTDFAGDGFPIARNGNGKIDVFVNGVNVYHLDADSFRTQLTAELGDAFPGSDLKIGYTTRHYGDFGGTNRAADAYIDECATYGNNVLSGTPCISDARIAHHYAVGTGSTGGTVASGATYYARNDANTAWIALNMAALKQEMPERREFPVLEVWPDGRSRRFLGRWGEPETFGFEKGAFAPRRSGLVVPRQFAMG